MSRSKQSNKRSNRRGKLTPSRSRHVSQKASIGATSQLTPPFPKQHQPKPGQEHKLQPRPRYQAHQYKSAGKLKRKVALITGGDSGIGRAIAVLFAREGADVAIVYLPEEEKDARETQRMVASEKRRALLIPGDLTISGFCSEAVKKTVRELGALDILVNNAAFQQHQKGLEEVSHEQWEHTFNKCLRLLLAREGGFTISQARKLHH